MAAKAINVAPESAGARKIKILLVDDTPANLESLEAALSGLGEELVLAKSGKEALRHLLTELLQSYGYTVLQAEDGVAGLERFTHHRDEIKAVITDMGLPRMSGQDLFTRIREVDPCSRVVLASGYLDPELKTQLFSLGAKAFLQKPYQPADILRVIRGVIDVNGHVEKEVPS